MARIVVHYSRPPGTNAALFREALPHGLEAMLKYWHKHYVPLHFKPLAMRRYGYQPRSGTGEGPYVLSSYINPKNGKLRRTSRQNPKYLWQKKRKKGHMDPLVYTGESRRIAQDPRFFDIRTTGRSARGVITGLESYFYKFHKSGSYVRRRWTSGGTPTVVTIAPQPDKAKELRTIRDDELNQMQKVGRARITTFIDNYRRPVTVAAG